MEDFLKFILEAKRAAVHFDGYKTIHLVLGNESCDLDSTVSALSLAYLIHSLYCAADPQYLVIPVMNVEAKYFLLRTETCYLLRKYGIDPQNFVFKDQIDYSVLLKSAKVKTSLVDHHVLSNRDKVLEQTVVQIFDHRIINTREICQSPMMEQQIIKIVGSCSTLIADEIITSDASILFEELCQLLYATIIYDTIALDKECGKTFDEDVTVARKLEDILKIASNTKELFDQLWKIHNDTSSLTTKDLLYRDLKVVKGVPIPGLPMAVEDYLKQDDAAAALESFAVEYNSSTVVLIGIDASRGVKRDIAIYSTDPQFSEILINTLKNSKKIAGSDLSLTEVSTNIKNVCCFRQGNVKLTRKFILPLVNEAASQCVKTT